MSRTIVIGGGVAGLATAALLAKEGHDVTLLERNDRLGGRVGEIVDGGFRFETGPSWYLMPQVFDHFFALMGTTTQRELDLTLLDPAYRVFSEPAAETGSGAAATGTAEVFEVPAGARRVRAAFESREPGAARVLRRYLARAGEAMELATEHVLYNPFTALGSLARADVLRKLPGLLPLLTTSLETFVAARFRDPVLRQVLGYPAVFLGTEPRSAPSIYHLMSRLDLDEGVLYPQGGFSAVVASIERLAREAGATLLTGAEVTRITTDEGAARPRARVTGVEWVDADGTVHREAADVVVSGADLHHTETELLDAPRRTYPETWWSRRTSGPGAVLVMLGVRGELPQLAHHSLFFTRDWRANFAHIFGRHTSVPMPASSYVCRPSATDPDVAPAGHENLFVLVPVPPDPFLGSGGRNGAGDRAVESAADRAIDQIAQWAQIPDLRERIVVRHTLGPADFLRSYHSWRGGMLGPAHTLRQSAMFRAGNASRRVAGLYYAGATVSPGVGVPMCLISAELVLKHVRGDSSAGPLPEPTGTAAGGGRP